MCHHYLLCTKGDLIILDSKTYGSKKVGQSIVTQSNVLGQ